MVKDTTQRPAVVGLEPVELRLGQPGRALDEEACRLIDAPEPRFEIGLAQGQQVAGQRHRRGDPALGGRGHLSVIAPREPLIDLVQVVQGVVEHAAKRLARGVGVPVDACGSGERRRARVGEP